MLLIPLAGLAQNLPRVSLRGERAADAFVQGVFERWAGKGQHAVLLSDWEHMTPLWYARFVEGRALDPADLTPVYVAGTSASPWVDAIWAHIGDGPIYLIEYRRDVIEAGFRLRAEGDSLWRRALPPAEALVPPPIPYPLAAQAGPIRLLGFDLAPTGGTPPGGTVRLILYFTAPRTPSDILQPVARLGPWTYAYTTDSHLLTPYWTPGEVVGERWDFTLPLDAAPGDYPLSLSIANLTAGEGLPWEGGRDDLPLATVRVESGIRSPRGETAGLAANFGQREGLVGARVKLGGGEWVGAPWPVPIQVRAGEGIEIRLRWRALLPDQSSGRAGLYPAGRRLPHPVVVPALAAGAGSDRSLPPERAGGRAAGRLHSRSRPVWAAQHSARPAVRRGRQHGRRPICAGRADCGTLRKTMAEFFDTYAPLLWLITTALVLIALAWLAWLSFEREQAVGESGVDPDELERMAGQVSQLLWATMEMKTSLSGSLQGVGLVRFDAYPDAGGQQSFSVALTNAQGDGVVISSLHGRANTRVFAKPLSMWNSDIQLSNEELAAIEQARGQAQGAAAGQAKD
ncbi:MAG: DUF4446 family protein [Chloroflexi bacterium]|nr:DUF4446 family protein [Chloroflexota bacterium]